MSYKNPLFGITRPFQYWPAVSVLSACILLTIFSLSSYKKDIRQKTLELASLDAIEYQRTLEEGIRSYLHLNRDVMGFFAASGHVTRLEFDEFMKAVKALETHPGLGYLRYIPRVATSDIPLFEATTRQDFPSFKIHGVHKDPDYIYPGLHGYPYSESANRFTGYDFSGNPQRWEAMQKARDEGESIASKKSTYLSDPNKSSVSILTPVFAIDTQHDTVAQRRAMLTGFISSTFDIREVIEGILGNNFQTFFDLEIFDTEVSPENLLYDGDRRLQALAKDHATYPLAHQQEIEFAGRTWSLYFYPKPIYFHQSGLDDHGWLILLSGSLASVVLVFLAWKWQRQRYSKRLQIAHALQFQAVFEKHPSAVFSLDLQHCFINANAKTLEMLEVSKDELIGAPILQFVTPENMPQTIELLHEVGKGNAVSYDNAIISGKRLQLDVSIVMIPVSIDGKIVNYMGIAQNVTERKQAERIVQESRAMLQLVIDTVPQRVFWKDVNSIFKGCNKALCEEAGFNTPNEIIGKTDYDFAWKHEAEAYRADDQKTMHSGISKINYEELQRRKDGSQYWLRTSKIPLKNGEGHLIGVLGMYEDITERKLIEQKLEYMAHYDSLTGVANRAFVHELLQQAINRSKRHGTLLGIMYFDIDKFKSINDIYGHHMGDAILTLFAKRIKATVREIDTIGRLGGDEFCLIAENLVNREAASSIAEKLIDAMLPVFQIGETTLQVSTSIGVAFHEPGMAADELLRRADQAMYLAKQTGRNRFKLESV